jgi:hypothetical protein
MIVLVGILSFLFGVVIGVVGWRRVSRPKDRRAWLLKGASRAIMRADRMALNAATSDYPRDELMKAARLIEWANNAREEAERMTPGRAGALHVSTDG